LVYSDVDFLLVSGAIFIHMVKELDTEELYKTEATTDV
jgi:hypothetical protein